MTVKRIAYVFVFIVVIAGAAAAGWFIWQQRLSSKLPEGIVSANGRIEANEVDIATKLAGRVLDISPREGDTVEAGAVVARLDAAESEAQLRQSIAEGPSVSCSGSSRDHEPQERADIRGKAIRASRGSRQEGDSNP